MLLGRESSCRLERPFVSDRVGDTVVRARLAAISKEQAFSFFLPPISVVAIAFALLEASRGRAGYGGEMCSSVALVLPALGS